MTLRSISFRLALITTLLLPVRALAAGGSDISAIASGLVTLFAPLWVTVGVLVLVVAGFTLVTSTDESKLEKARSTLIAIVMGGMITTIIYTLGSTGFVGFMYSGTAGFALNASGAIGLGAEAAGAGEWLMGIAVLLGTVYVIVAAVAAVASFGDDAKYQAARTSLLHVVLGLILLSAVYVLKRVFFEVQEPTPLIAFVAAKVLIILNIITTIAVGIIVYAGLRMVISIGNEDEFNKAKSLAIRAAFGILIILASYALVIIVANVFA